MLELLEMVGKQRLETVFDWNVNSVALDDRVSQRVPTPAHAHCTLSCLLYSSIQMKRLGTDGEAPNHEPTRLFAQELWVGYGRLRRYGRVWSQAWHDDLHVI